MTTANLPLTILNQPPQGQPGPLTVTWTPPAGITVAVYRALLDGYPAQATWGDGTTGPTTFNPAETQTTVQLPDGALHTLLIDAWQVAAEGLLEVGEATPTFESATAHLDDPLPDLTHATVATSAADFTAKLAAAKVGDVIHAQGSWQIPGTFTSFNRIVSGGTVQVVIDPTVKLTGYNTYFSFDNRKYAALVRNSGGWRVWGGDISNPKGGGGILIYPTPGPFKWTGFRVHDTADQCVAVYAAAGGLIANVVLKGVAGTANPYLGYDPHSEKGTGIHAWNLADAIGQVKDCVFACDTLWQATGAAVQIETDRIAGTVTVYARAKHVGFPYPGGDAYGWKGYAQHQTAGNVIQLWGGAMPGTLEVDYAEGADIQGRMLQTGAVTGDISKAKIAYGRATGPILQSPLATKPAYQVAHGLVLGDCEPLP